MIGQLEELGHQQHKWTGLKKLRSRPVLKLTKFKDKDGKRIKANSSHIRQQNTQPIFSGKATVKFYHRAKTS